MEKMDGYGGVGTIEIPAMEIGLRQGLWYMYRGYGGGTGKLRQCHGVA